MIVHIHVQKLPDLLHSGFKSVSVNVQIINGLGCVGIKLYIIQQGLVIAGFMYLIITDKLQKSTWYQSPHRKRIGAPVQNIMKGIILEFKQPLGTAALLSRLKGSLCLQIIVRKQKKISKFRTYP